MRSAALALTLLFVAGAVTLWVASSRREAASSGIETQLLAAIEGGGIGELGTAQSLGRRLVAQAPGRGRPAAALALADAILAVEYGVDSLPEAEHVLAARDGGSAPADPALVTQWSMEAAARALMELQAGKREAAARRAAAAAAAAPGTAYPLYVLGRVRAREGDLLGAERALEAAIVADPAFLAAQRARAEVALDLGHAEAARTGMATLRRRSGRDLHAALLWLEAQQALGPEVAPTDPRAGSRKEPANGTGGSGTTEGGAADTEPCRDESSASGVAGTDWPPPFFRAACAWSQAVRARLAGRRGDALAEATRAAQLAPREPRLLAHIAEALAQLGAVDLAAHTLDEARALAGTEMPAVLWAAAAVALGRGRAPSLPEGPRPADPETRWLVARAAFAAGGLEALKTTLDALGEEALRQDHDLRLFARLRDVHPAVPLPPLAGGGTAATAAAPARARPQPVVAPDTVVAAGAARETPADEDDDDPVRAYVEGLTAQFEGDLPAAAERFWHALSGHADACRAVGEYVATLRALKLPADPAAWRALLQQNASCVNLR